MATKYILHLPSVLPQGWETAVLEDIASFANGLWKGKKQPYLTARVLRNTNFNNDGTLDYSDIAELLVQVNQFSPRQLRSGDIILERSGGGPSQPVGRVVFFDRKDSDFSFSNFTTRVRVTDEFVSSPKYLLYFLLHFYSTGHTNALQSRTTGIRNLMFSDYKQVVVPLPPLDEQRRIAAVLTAIQDAIAAQEDVIAAAQAFKRSLMHRLFTYGPGRVPAETKETEIGEIPSHWDMVTVENVLNVKLGKMLSQKAKQGISPRLYMRNANVQWGRIDLTNVAEMDFAPNEREKFRLEKDDILVCEGGEVGRTAIWNNQLEECYYQKAIHRLRPKSKSTISPYYFLHYMMLIFLVRNVSVVEGARSTIAHIPVAKLKALPLALPHKSEQDQIVGAIGSIDAKIAAEEDRKAALDALFKSMLHQLMTGQIRLLIDEGLPVV